MSQGDPFVCDSWLGRVLVRRDPADDGPMTGIEVSVVDNSGIVDVPVAGCERMNFEEGRIHVERRVGRRLDSLDYRHSNLLLDEVVVNLHDVIGRDVHGEDGWVLGGEGVASGDCLDPLAW